MKLKVSQLRQIIKEEISHVLNESMSYYEAKSIPSAKEWLHSMNYGWYVPTLEDLKNVREKREKYAALWDELIEYVEQIPYEKKRKFIWTGKYEFDKQVLDNLSVKYPKICNPENLRSDCIRIVKDMLNKMKLPTGQELLQIANDFDDEEAIKKSEVGYKEFLKRKPEEFRNPHLKPGTEDEYWTYD